MYCPAEKLDGGASLPLVFADERKPEIYNSFNINVLRASKPLQSVKNK
jgi:hypothetical protein